MNGTTLFGSPMLREIEIADFRGISQLRLSFLGPDNQPGRIAVIGGPNGSGKTSALEACLIATGNTELIRGASGPKAIRQGAHDYTIKASFQSAGGTKQVEYHSTPKVNPFKVKCDYFSSWRAPKLIGAVPVTAGKKGKRPAVTEENRLWTIKQLLVNAKAYVSMSPQPMILSEYDEVIDKVNEIWEMFYPGQKQTFSVEPAGDDPDAGFDVFLNIGDKQRVPLDALSSGQIELFLLAGSALPRREKESILCIDEPELHLDPQWHRLILRAMMKLRPTCQFIVGTHSPEIYDSVMSYERHFLVSEDDPRAYTWGQVRSGGDQA